MGVDRWRHKRKGGQSAQFGSLPAAGRFAGSLRGPRLATRFPNASLNFGESPSRGVAGADGG